ncbi:MAG: choice-of-anchor J domain-containing protein [Bacteroidales bacterium]|nr:choice-of-anchor J domain-containing protein [Bacteroidales bacterium]
MQKFLRTLMLAALLLPFVSQAQNTLTVADGTATNTYVPIYGLYVDELLRCQTIYPATEIAASATNFFMAGGTITGMTYYLSTPATASWGAANFVIKIKEVAATTLTAFVDMTDATTVYNGTLDGTQSTLAITFATPYTYQGGNLLIEVCNTVNGTYKSATFSGVSATGASWQGHNSSSIDNITGSAQGFIPKTTFTFTGGTANTCPPVSGLTVSDITSTSATLSWSGNASGYVVYEHANVDSADYMYTDTFAVFNTLLPNTEYTFGVVADCGTDGVSAMQTITFRTACAAAELPWTCGFETNEIQSTTQATALPWCTSRYVSPEATSGTSYPYSYSSSTNAHTGSRCLYYYGSTSDSYPNVMALILPEVDVNTYPMNGNRITFWAKMGTASNSKYVYVYSMSSPTDIATATVVDSVLVSGTTNALYSLSLANATATNPYLALVVLKGTGSLYMDDVTLEETPSCVEVTSLATSNITSTSVDLAWNDNSNASTTTYSVYSIANGTQTLIEDNITTTNYTVTNLTPNTSYTFGVQANCASGDASVMTISATTLCASETMPWSENFDDWTAKSACWSFLSGAFNGGAGTPSVNSSAWSLNTAYGSYITITGKALTMNIYSTNRYWAVTPNINITSDDALFSVDVAVSAWSNETPNYDANDTLAIAISTDGGSTFTALRVLDNTELNALTSTYTTIMVPVTGYNNQAVRFAIFGGSSASGGDNRIVIDNVTVGEAPNCMPVTGLTVSNVTATGATLSWTGNASGYTIYDMSDTSLYQYASDTTIDITALDAMTQYTFGVAADCGSEESDTVIITFNTACTAVALPYTEDFEATSTTLGCWTTDGPGNWTVATGDYSTTTGAFSGSTNAKITHGTTGNATKLISPVLDNVTNGMSLTFAHIQRSWSGDQDELYVYYRTGADSAWQQVAEYTTEISTWTVDNVLIPGEVYQVAFEMIDGYGYGVAIDSVVFGEAPNCMPVTDLAVDSTTATSIFLSWTGNASSYSIYGATGSVVATGITTTNYEITGLTASTSYTFGVVANCGSDNSEAVTITAATGCSGTSCEIEIVGSDSYGDGWNGNAINVIQNGVTIHTFTVDVDAASNYISVCSGSPVSFSWVSGQYPDEVSFEIKINGGFVTYTCTDATGLTNDSVFHTIANACPTCSAPSISVTDASMNSVTISWTGNALSYDVFNGTTFVANVTTNTYTFTGLTPATNYTFGVVANCSATDTSVMATVTVGTSCGVISTFPYTQDFSAVPACWNAIDADGDGYNWSLISGAMHSASYENYVGPLTPNNWLITPQFQLAANTSYEVTWNADPQDVLYPAEHYGLYVSTTTADTSAFTLVQEWTLTDAGHVPVVDLSTYAGQTIYLAFRHWNCTDMYRIAIDNFQLREAAGANQITVTLTQNNPMYGSVAGGGVYNIGDSVTVTATPNTSAGYQFEYWMSNMGSIVYANPYTFVAATDITLQAIFSDGTTPALDSMQVNIAVNDPTMGTTNPAPGVHYFYTGQDASVIAIPNNGYHLEGWSIMVVSDGSTLMDTTFNYAVDDVFDLFDGWTVEEGDEDYVWTVTANFAAGTIEQHDSLTVITACNNEAWGTITPAAGTHYYVVGDTVIVGAIPNDGYYVSMVITAATVPGIGEFVDTLYAEDLEDEPLLDTLIVDEDYMGMILDIKVIFAPVGGVNTYTVTVNYDPTMGTVEGIPTEPVAAGTQVTLTARANEGYHFSRWSNGETSATITITVTSDITLEAFFERNTGIEDATAVDFNVYGKDGRIMLQGAEGREVYVFDVNGRMLHHTAVANMTESYNAPATGLYIVKVMGVGTKRVVIVR